MPQIDHHRLGRKRFPARGRRADVFAAAALHAGVEAEQLLAFEIVEVVHAGPARFFHLGYGQRDEGAHRSFGADGDVHRPRDDVEETVERDGGEEARDQNRVQPPRWRCIVLAASR